MADETEDKTWKIGVRVDSESWDNNDGEDSNERYRYRGTTTTRWDVRGLKLIESNEDRYGRGIHEIVEVNFEPHKGKLYHLLYAVYSTGDSFGHDEGRCFEVIGLYKSRKVADENLKRLHEGKPSVKGDWGAELVSMKFEGTKKPHNYYRPWGGYFDRLDRLEVESFVLN
jgi:hypothetical protein